MDGACGLQERGFDHLRGLHHLRLHGLCHGYAPEEDEKEKQEKEIHLPQQT